MKRQTRTATIEPVGARREEIVAAAAELFHRRGFHGTTTQDIADEVGLLKGSLYHYISTKVDLLYEVVDAVHTALDENMARCAAAEATAFERLVLFVHGHLDVAVAHMTSGRVCAHDLDQLDERRRREILDRRERYERFFQALVRECQTEGSVSRRFDGDLLGTTVLASLTSVYRWYRPEVDPVVVRDTYTAMILEGIAVDR